MKKKLEELRNSGAKIYSFSKLGSFNNCEYEYYNTYILRNRGIENIYTIMGSQIHKGLEDIYGGTGDIDKFKTNFENKLLESEMASINFPNESIGNSWKSDMNHFLKHFEKMDKKMVQEKLIVFEVGEGIYFQGYIDAILPSDQGKPYVDVLDWKTSSKFTGKKLTESGRQLLLYKLGLEQTSNVKVDKIMWFMVKYLYVCNMQKNGKVKKKMCNRGKWVKEMRKQLEKEMYKLDMAEFEVELLLDKAVQDNDITDLPKEVKDIFWLEDCFVEYEATDDKIEELKQYIVTTVKAIESKNVGNKDDWKPVEIDKYNSFYCSTLCGHRKHCEFYKAFLDENVDSFEKKDKKDDFSFENLFG